MLEYNGEFEYKHEIFTGYKIGKFIVDLREDLVEVEVYYHQPFKNSVKLIKHPFKVDMTEVDMNDLLDKIYKLHYGC